MHRGDTLPLHPSPTFSPADWPFDHLVPSEPHAAAAAAATGVVAYGLLNELYYTTAFAFLWLGPMGAAAIVAPASLGLRETFAISAKQFGKVRFGLSADPRLGGSIRLPKHNMSGRRNVNY